MLELENATSSLKLKSEREVTLEASSTSHIFDVKDREPYQRVMRNAGYVELEQFQAHLDGFCCASCEYMRKMKTSPTEYWCKSKGFPDRPNGCCDAWEPIPGLIKNGLNRKET